MPRSPHGFAAAQTYIGQNKIVFAVADGGIGVRQSLMDRYSPKDDADALRIAVEYGVSGTGEASSAATPSWW
jgi:hypothetical protein